MELPLQQHPNFGAALGMIGADVRRINIAGAAPTQVLKRFGISFAPRGPVWADDARALRNSHIRIINAETQSDLYKNAGYRRIMTPAHVAELDLKDSAANRLAKTRPNWRRELNKAKLKIKWRNFDANLHQWLLDADRAQQRSKGYRALPHNIVQAYAALYPDDVIVAIAELKKNTVAAMLFLKHAPVVTYHIGWTNDAGRKRSAHHTLLMEAADHFADANTRLDLGTVDTEATPGLARFKIGSGATIRPLGGTWLRLPGF